MGYAKSTLIAHAIIVMRNCSVAGSIDGHAARSDTQIQAAHLRDSVQQFQRSVSGHQAIEREWPIPRASRDTSA
jgi:hypothetical protein